MSNSYSEAGPSRIFSQGIPPSSQLPPSSIAPAKPAAQRCENCRSRKLYVQDGRLWCRRCGTLREDFVQTQPDDDFEPLRSSQVTRQKREAVDKTSKTLTGIKSLYLYLSAYQLILQHLCRTLINEKGLPAAVEPLVKDLWELRMGVVRERYLAAKPGDAGDEDSDATTTVYSSQTEAEQTQTENEEATDASGSERRSAQVRKERDYPSIVDMLGLCYFSCMILRIPLSLAMLFRWATQEEIPFLQPLRLVPADMHHRLSQRWLLLLQTRAPLQPSKLYSSVHDLYTLYNRHFDILLPSLNYTPLLYQYITTLSLPMDLFPAVTHLSTILPSSFNFAKPRRRYTFLTLPEVNLVVFIAISIKLFHPFSNAPQNPSATLEGKDLKLGTLPLNWEVWTEAQRNLSQQIKTLPEASLQTEKQIQITAEDVFSLDENEMDAYMDWYERTWTTSTPRQFSRNATSAADENDNQANTGGILGEIMNMFPPSRHQTHQHQHQHQHPQTTPQSNQDRERTVRNLHEETLRSIQFTSYTSIDTTNHNDNPPPGKKYLHYRYPSDLGDPNTPARIFHERLAELAGLQVSDLLKAIYNTERKLIKWWSRERKRREKRDSDDDDDDGHHGSSDGARDE